MDDELTRTWSVNSFHLALIVGVLDVGHSCGWGRVPDRLARSARDELFSRALYLNLSAVLSMGICVMGAADPSGQGAVMGAVSIILFALHLMLRPAL